MRCVRKARAGSYFCSQHRNAVDGAVLGMCMAGLLDDSGERSRKFHKACSTDAAGENANNGAT
jgi:hypothetical protein